MIRDISSNTTNLETTLHLLPSSQAYRDYVEQRLIDFCIDFSRFDVVATIHDIIEECCLQPVTFEQNKIRVYCDITALAIEAFILAMECPSQEINISIVAIQISPFKQEQIICTIKHHLQAYDMKVS